MPETTLKKLLGKEAWPALERLLAAIGEPLGILDLNGSLLLGTAPVDSPLSAAPILYGDSPIGQVVGQAGSDRPAAMAILLGFLLSKDQERRALAAEVLGNYRELHLLYRLSEKLFASLEPEAIAGTMLNEVGPLVQVEGGLVALQPENEGELEVLASFKASYPLQPGVEDPRNLVGRVFQTGVTEISNNLAAEEYFQGMEGRTISLLCAPLKTEKRNLGVILFFSDGSRQFTANDLKLVNAVAMQTAPAIEIARFHQVELEKAVLERDLQTARQVQSALLPDRMPVLQGWRVSAHWQPARAVGGDFYEFIRFPGGGLGLAIADVTDKGVPAALMMANTRSVLRAVAATSRHRKGLSPGQLLAQVNNLLCDDMPAKMFVTCLLVILDPETGRAIYANAGHNLAYHRTPGKVTEMRATGVPLGLFTEMDYEDKEIQLEPGDSVLMYSDGLIEAHNEKGEMFGMKHLHDILAYPERGQPLHGERLIRFLLSELAAFTGPYWEQEDDVTLVTLERCLPQSLGG